MKESIKKDEEYIERSKILRHSSRKLRNSIKHMRSHDNLHNINYQALNEIRFFGGTDVLVLKSKSCPLRTLNFGTGKN